MSAWNGNLLHFVAMICLQLEDQGWLQPRATANLARPVAGAYGMDHLQRHLRIGTVSWALVSLLHDYQRLKGPPHTVHCDHRLRTLQVAFLPDSSTRLFLEHLHYTPIANISTPFYRWSFYIRTLEASSGVAANTPSIPAVHARRCIPMTSARSCVDTHG